MPRDGQGRCLPHPDRVWGEAGETLCRPEGTECRAARLGGVEDRGQGAACSAGRAPAVEAELAQARSCPGIDTHLGFAKSRL